MATAGEAIASPAMVEVGITVESAGWPMVDIQAAGKHRAAEAEPEKITGLPMPVERALARVIAHRTTRRRVAEHPMAAAKLTVAVTTSKWVNAGSNGGASQLRCLHFRARNAV